jgi:hypothetical protein
MLLIDYSSAFNTIVPSKLISKFKALDLNPALCNWVLDILKGRPQVVKLRSITSTPLIVNTEALFTHDCVAKHTSSSFIRFSDDTTVIRLDYQQ